MSFLRHGESIAPMMLVPLGASGLASSQCSSDATSSSRLFLGRLLSSRACLRFAGRERFSKTKPRRTMLFQRTATAPLTPCLTPRVHSREALLPLVRLAATLSADIKEYDKKIEELGREKYGHTALLRQVKGVGPITALAYVLTLENPERFAKSRDVGPYLGWVPKQEDSGESQPQLGISKAGDTMVRKLLVGSAQYLLGPFGPDTDLRRYGLRLCERGGKNAKKRAAVAVARKLAVLLHRLWVSGEVYEPLRHGMAATTTPAVAA